MAGSGVYPGVFNGEAANLNPLPYAQQYIGMLAHQQAQRDASRKYLGELGTRLTPTGMVDEDAQALINKKNEWQNFNIQNQRKIANTNLDGGQAYLQSMKMFNDMQDLINKSKYKAQMGTYIKQTVNSPQKEALLTPESLDAIHHQMAPVYLPNGQLNPDHKSMTQADIQFKPQPFDDKQIRLLQPLLPPAQKNYDLANVQKDQTTQKLVVPYNTDITPAQVGTHRDIGINHYQVDPGFRQTIDNINSTDNILYPNLNQISQKYLGHPLDPLNKADVATAYTLSLNKTIGEHGTTTPETLPPSLQDQIRKQTNIHAANRLFDVNHPLPTSKGTQAQITGQNATQTWEDMKSHASPVSQYGVIQPYNMLPIDSKTALALGAPDKLGVKQPIQGIKYFPDTKEGIIVQQDGTEGARLPETELRSRVIGEISGKGAANKINAIPPTKAAADKTAQDLINKYLKP